VVADLMDIARAISRSGSGRVAPLSYVPDELSPKPLLPLGEIHSRCYLRFGLVDEPGALSHITGALGENGIGIESVVQKGRGHEGGSVPVIVLTHPAPEAAVRNAISEIDALDEVTEATCLIRIEEDL
jgi:homoserine dehydrogenase